MEKIRGFTLVELMITLAIAAIVLTFAVPSFTAIIKNNRIITQANEMVTALNLARSEAIKRTTIVNVVSTNNSTDWSGGWRVEVNGGATLRTFDALDPNLSFTSGVDTYQYNAQGFISVAGSNDVMTLCDDRTGETGRQVVISASGRPNINSFVCP